jgi:hypothetical protein
MSCQCEFNHHSCFHEQEHAITDTGVQEVHEYAPRSEHWSLVTLSKNGVSTSVVLIAVEICRLTTQWPQGKLCHFLVRRFRILCAFVGLVHRMAVTSGGQAVGLRAAQDFRR